MRAVLFGVELELALPGVEVEELESLALGVEGPGNDGRVEDEDEDEDEDEFVVGPGVFVDVVLVIGTAMVVG